MFVLTELHHKLLFFFWQVVLNTQQIFIDHGILCEQKKTKMLVRKKCNRLLKCIQNNAHGFFLYG